MGTELIRSSPALEYANAGLVKVEMSQQEAREERRKWEGGTAHERQVAHAYRAIEEGRQLIDLEKSLQKGGCDQVGRPKLAIAQVGMKRVKLETWYGTGVVEYSAGWIGWSYTTEFAGAKTGRDGGVRAVASTPTMPPAVRRIANDTDILFWEAQWRRTEMKRQIVIDPALLEPVVGTLYVVKAAWELTELEAAALRG